MPPSSSAGKLRLEPLGKTLDVPCQTPLREALFMYGVEFPCGARGACKGCRVRVMEGEIPPTLADRRHFSEYELSRGWRLSCKAIMPPKLVLELPLWDSFVLSDHSAVPIKSRDGIGIVVDLGTTTLVAQCVDLSDGKLLGVESALNPQAMYGADLMSRLAFACDQSNDGARILREIIREKIGEMLRRLLLDAEQWVARKPLLEILIAGNTAMHHLFCGIPPEPLSHYPFESGETGKREFTPAELNWSLPNKPVIQFLPCIGGFVGSDLLAGILAANLHRTNETESLVDLGTNGEIIVARRGQLFCASTAAGPAFEGASIRMGMRAGNGAIAKVTPDGENFHCETLGPGPLRGLCGSGLVDAVATGLELGKILSSGRIRHGDLFLMLKEPVKLYQEDIRELQLAKGAIAAGLSILLEEAGDSTDSLRRLNLAGAFGNYINQYSASRVGLLTVPSSIINPMGNSVLMGLKKRLFDPETDGEIQTILRNAKHVSLHAHANFQDIYVEHMKFPQREMSEASLRNP